MANLAANIAESSFKLTDSVTVISPSFLHARGLFDHLGGDTGHTGPMVLVWTVWTASRTEAIHLFCPSQAKSFHYNTVESLCLDGLPPNVFFLFPNGGHIFF